jgi:hypothetical protein
LLSSTIREEYSFREYDDRVLRKILGSKRAEMTGGWEGCIMRSFATCTIHKILLGHEIKENMMGRTRRKHGRDDKGMQYFGWKI